MKACTLAVIIITAGCRGDHSKLRERVDSYCSLLRSDVDRALTQYQRFADSVPAGSAVSPESEALLSIDSIGTTELVRRARLRDFNNRFQFCVRARRFDDRQADELQDRSLALASSLYAAPALQDPRQTVQLLQQYAALVGELKGAPYIE